jgi:hypothetical protein
LYSQAVLNFDTFLTTNERSASNWGETLSEVAF